MNVTQFFDGIAAIILNKPEPTREDFMLVSWMPHTRFDPRLRPGTPPTPRVPAMGPLDPRTVAPAPYPPLPL